MHRCSGPPARPGACAPPPRTKWTRRVLHPVLIGHAASLTPPSRNTSTVLMSHHRGLHARTPGWGSGAAPLVRGEGHGVSDQYGGWDEACPISTGGGGTHSRALSEPVERAIISCCVSALLCVSQEHQHLRRRDVCASRP
jgi:hypothetical protein